MRVVLSMIFATVVVLMAGCTKVQPLQFEEEPVAPVQTVEQEEPTVESEIPVTTDEEIVTQPDTSL